MWKVEVKWRNHYYRDGSESTMTVVNVSIIKSYNKVIFTVLYRSVKLLEVITKQTHSSSYQLILSSINSYDCSCRVESDLVILAIYLMMNGMSHRKPFYHHPIPSP